jgi:hypothetical protein
MGCVIGPNDPRAIDLQRGLADGSIFKITDENLEASMQKLAEIVGKLPVGKFEGFRKDSAAYAEYQQVINEYRKLGEE